MHYRSFLVLSASLATLYASPAFAVTGEELFDRMQKLLASQPVTISVGKIEEQGDNITFQSFKMTQPYDEQAPELIIDEITFSDLSENADGTYLASKAAIVDIEKSFDDGKLSISGVEMLNLEFPMPTPQARIFFTDFKTETVSYSLNGSDIVVMRGIKANFERNSTQTEMTFDTDVTSINVDLQKLPPSPPKQTMADLGYLTLVGSINLDGGYDLNSGDLSVTDFNLDVKDAGKLTFSFNLTGYDLALFTALTELKTSVEPEVEKKATTALLAQELSFKSGIVRFDDASMTNKILDYQATQQGTDRKSLVQLAKVMLPFALTGLKAPAFAEKVSQSIGAFLDNPNSIQITAQPESPVGMNSLSEETMKDPQKIIETFNVDVQANR